MKTMMIESAGPVRLAIGGKVWTIRERETAAPALPEALPEKREMMDVMALNRRGEDAFEVALYGMLAVSGIALDIILAVGYGLI